MDTCTMPCAARSTPIACTFTSPPLLSRSPLAMLLAIARLVVPRFMLKAMSGVRARRLVHVYQAERGGCGSERRFRLRLRRANESQHGAVMVGVRGHVEQPHPLHAPHRGGHLVNHLLPPALAEVRYALT